MTKTRTPAQLERDAEAKTAWSEYLGEREILAARTAQLREMRLAAEAEAAKPVRKKKKK